MDKNAVDSGTFPRKPSEIQLKMGSKLELLMQNVPSNWIPECIIVAKGRLCEIPALDQTEKNENFLCK